MGASCHQRGRHPDEQLFHRPPGYDLGRDEDGVRAVRPPPTCEPYPEHPLEALLAEAVQNVHGEIAAYDREEELEGEDHSIEADPAVRNFSYTLVNGQIYYRENSRMNPVEVSKTAESRIRGMIELRDCVRALLEYQTEDYPDEEIKSQQAKLNALFVSFTL